MNTFDTSPLYWGMSHLAEDPAETPAEVASNAIFSSNDNNTLQLQGSLQQGLVDATTTTASGETLVVLAVRIDKPRAFEDLVRDFPEHRAQEFNQQDGNGDTLLHHMARHRPQENFAPGLQNAWRRVVLNFLEVFGAALDGGVHNHEGETAWDLASRLGNSHLAKLLKSSGGSATHS